MKLKVIVYPVLVVLILMSQGCLSYILSGFTVIEKSKFIKPQWVEFDGFCIHSSNLSFVHKQAKAYDLPLGLKKSQEDAISNIQKILPAEIKSKLRLIANTNGIKIYNTSGLNKVSFLQNSFATKFTLTDIYYEKLASTDENPDFYKIDVLMQLTEPDHSLLCSSLIKALAGEKSSDLAKLSKVLESAPNNCMQ